MLNLKAAPNSKIAVTAVDTSIHFLAQGNDLKKKDVSHSIKEPKLFFCMSDLRC